MIAAVRGAKRNGSVNYDMSISQDESRRLNERRTVRNAI